MVYGFTPPAAHVHVTCESPMSGCDMCAREAYV